MNKLRILLYDLKSTNKEFQELLNTSPPYNISLLFKNIFSINSYTNTDMYNFLSIYELYDNKEVETLKKIVNLKFFQGEKDTDQVILKYFQVLTSSTIINVCNTINDVSNPSVGVSNTINVSNLLTEISNPLFERFIILLNSPLFSPAINNEIFKYFQIFLINHPDFLDKSIINLKDDSLRYRLLINSIDIRYVFLVPSVLLLLLDNTRSKYLLQEYYDDIPRWYINSLSENILRFLYFNFDSIEIYKDVSYKYFSKLNISEMISEFKKAYIKNKIDKKIYDYKLEDNYIRDDYKLEDNYIRDDYKLEDNYIRDDYKLEDNIRDLTNERDNNIRDITNERDNNIRDLTNERDNNIKISMNESGKIINLNPPSLIESFNINKDITDLYEKYKKSTFLLLRYHHLTNLRSLGEFLCNHKNLKYLVEFTDTYDFTNMNILVGLRLYLSGFYLVGESQIIHRVLEVFSKRYVVFNNYDTEFILNLSFSLLLLNTKMYNPNIKTRPTYEEYISDFNKEEIPEDISMIDLYNSIRSSKIVLPDNNERSIGHYEIYKNLIASLSDRLNKKISLSDRLYDDHISDNYNYLTYLVDKSLLHSTTLLDTPHDKFLELCKLSSIQYIPLYLRYNKSDPYRFLHMFKNYLSYKGDIEVYKIFINIKTKKYSGLVTEIINKKISKENCKIVVELYKETNNNILLSMIESNIDKIESISYMDYDKQVYLMSKNIILPLIKGSKYSVKILRDVLESNPRYISREVIDIFKEVDDKSEDAFYTMISIQREEDMFNYVVSINENDINITNSINENDYNITNSINENDYNITNSINEIDNNIANSINENDNNITNSINEIDNNITNSINYDINNNITNSINDDINNITERYVINDNTKLFHFYSTSKYILNQSVLKRLITNGTCIRNSELVSPYNLDNRLIYLIYKCKDIENKEVVNYSLWIINLLSTSLPIFIEFFNRNINCLKRNLQNNIIKIFISRLKKVVTGLPLCCDCNYNKIGRVDMFISKLVEQNIVSIEDIEFWYVWKKEMNKEKRIVEEDGEYILIN